MAVESSIGNYPGTPATRLHTGADYFSGANSLLPITTGIDRIGSTSSSITKAALRVSHSKGLQAIVESEAAPNIPDAFGLLVGESEPVVVVEKQDLGAVQQAAAAHPDLSSFYVCGPQESLSVMQDSNQVDFSFVPIDSPRERQMQAIGALYFPYRNPADIEERLLDVSSRVIELQAQV